MALKKDSEPSELREWMDRLKVDAKQQVRHHMKFRVREGFAGGWTSGDLSGRTGDVVETTPERGAQLAQWLEPVEAQAAKPAATETDAPDVPEVPGAPPILNAMVGHAKHAGGIRTKHGKVKGR
jgi:hypothetical protein